MFKTYNKISETTSVKLHSNSCSTALIKRNSTVCNHMSQYAMRNQIVFFDTLYAYYAETYKFLLADNCATELQSQIVWRRTY